ncbi:MAG: hypothetical protein OXG04_20260 [Acidobacteria bacterium]|nr:hypothetical protein [Acidobacteriota bacterium]
MHSPLLCTTSIIAALGAILFAGCSSPRGEFDDILDRVMEQEMEIRAIYRTELDALVAENSEVPECPAVPEDLRDGLREVWTMDAREFFGQTPEQRAWSDGARETDDALHRTSRECNISAASAARQIETFRTWTRTEEEVREKYGNFALQIARMEDPVFLRTLEQLRETHGDKPANEADIAIVDAMVAGPSLQVDPDEAADRVAAFRTNFGNARDEVLAHLEIWAEQMETAQGYLE